MTQMCLHGAVRGKAMYFREVGDGRGHHSDTGVQYLSIRYTERLQDAGIDPSVGSVGDSYDNATAESVIGLFKTEVFRKQAPWRGLEAVEIATLQWVDWCDNRRLFGPLGHVPPAEFEQALHKSQEIELQAA